MRYEIIHACNKSAQVAITELKEEVAAYLENGWQLQGGVSLAVSWSDDHEDYFFDVVQAMTEQEAV